MNDNLRIFFNSIIFLGFMSLALMGCSEAAKQASVKSPPGAGNPPPPTPPPPQALQCEFLESNNECLYPPHVTLSALQNCQTGSASLNPAVGNLVSLERNSYGGYFISCTPDCGDGVTTTIESQETLFQATDKPLIELFCLDELTIPLGVNFQASNATRTSPRNNALERSLLFVINTTATIAGQINLEGTGIGPSSWGGVSGPGGYNGASRGLISSPGDGPCAGGGGDYIGVFLNRSGAGGGGGGNAGSGGNGSPGDATDGAGKSAVAGGGGCSQNYVFLEGGSGGGSGGEGSIIPSGSSTAWDDNFSAAGGGGALAIVARTAIDVPGIISANGGTAIARADNSSFSYNKLGGAGGGAGGSIILAAPDVQVSGKLSTDGGSGSLVNFNGGSGASRDSLAGGDGNDALGQAGGSGGGGGAGFIRIFTESGIIDCTGLASPTGSCSVNPLFRSAQLPEEDAGMTGIVTPPASLSCDFTEAGSECVVAPHVTVAALTSCQTGAPSLKIPVGGNAKLTQTQTGSYEIACEPHCGDDTTSIITPQESLAQAQDKPLIETFCLDQLDIPSGVTFYGGPSSLGIIAGGANKKYARAVALIVNNGVSIRGKINFSGSGRYPDPNGGIAGPGGYNGGGRIAPLQGQGPCGGSPGGTFGVTLALTGAGGGGGGYAGVGGRGGNGNTGAIPGNGGCSLGYLYLEGGSGGGSGGDGTVINASNTDWDDNMTGAGGGGGLAIISRTVIQIFGTIEANGGDAITRTDNSSFLYNQHGGGGGGAGGTIVLTAPQVEVSGRLEVMGGAGGLVNSQGAVGAAGTALNGTAGVDTSASGGPGGGGGGGYIRIFTATSASNCLDLADPVGSCAILPLPIAP